MKNAEFNDLCPEQISEAKAGVNYGEFIHETYMSKTTGLERGYNILLPENYSAEKKYPVLYFLHGIFCDEFSIPCDEKNRIKEIYKNLYNDNRTPEMIIVFPNMYASSDPNQKPSFSQKDVEPYNNFINDLVNDLIPHIQTKYSTYTDRDHRAILGFSMGGRETLFIGFSRSDLFSFFGAIAPAPGLTPAKDWAMEHPGQFKEEELNYVNPEYKSQIMICCGTSDKVVGQFPKSYHTILTKNEVEHQWFEVPEADHNDVANRSGFYNFLQKIFR